MKRYFCVIILFALTAAIFAQDKPRLAVVEFETNSQRLKVKEDAIAIRNLIRTNIVSSNKYEVITRDEIDKLLENQRIQISSIASPENIKKLQLININYIVTGTVDAIDNDYNVTISLLDVSTGRVSHQTNQFMSNTSADIINKTPLLVNNFQSSIIAQSDSTKTYKVGDTGPAGGIIFYDRGFVSDGWRYLEVAPAGTDFRAEWGTYGKDVSGTGTTIGSGKRNTQLIVDRLKVLEENDRAAQICAGMNINGYKDWFLPSKDELNLMYINLVRIELGEFKTVLNKLELTHLYCSSSQFNNSNIWCQHFCYGYQYDIDGLQEYFGKSVNYSVRAIRAF